MRISGASYSGAAGQVGGGGRKAAIKRQIKTLEAKAQKIMKKLSKMVGGGSSPQLSIGTGVKYGSASEAKQAIAEQSAILSSMTGTGAPAQTEAGASPATAKRAPMKVDASALRQALAATAPSPEEEEEDDTLPDDPKDLMKMFSATMAQIAMLRAQLEGDEDGLGDSQQSATKSVADAVVREPEGDTVSISADALALASGTGEASAEPPA